MEAAAAVAVEEPQHMEALAKANRTRLTRADFRRKVQAGEDHIERLLVEPPEWAESWEIAGLLRCQIRWGRIRARKFLMPLAISETRPLGRLTPRQRVAVIRALREAEEARRG